MVQLEQFNNPQNYKRTRKKKYTIKASMPPVGTKVHNHLEKVDYITDENKKFVLTGTVGEQWVVDVNKLMKTYIFEQGQEITKQELQNKLKDCVDHKDEQVCKVIPRFNIQTKVDISAPSNWAIFVPVRHTFQIPTSWGDMLTVNAPGIPHGTGDFIVCSDLNGYPNMNDRWVVNGEIFADTYDMRAFPNMNTSHSIKPIEDSDNPREFRGWNILTTNYMPIPKSDNQGKQEIKELNDVLTEKANQINDNAILQARDASYFIADHWAKITNNPNSVFKIFGGIVKFGSTGDYKMNEDHNFFDIKAKVQYLTGSELNIDIRVSEYSVERKGIELLKINCEGHEVSVTKLDNNLGLSKDELRELLRDLHDKVCYGEEYLINRKAEEKRQLDKAIARERAIERNMEKGGIFGLIARFQRKHT